MGRRRFQQGNYLMLERGLIKILGDTTAIILVELLDWEYYLVVKKEIQYGEPFFYLDKYITDKLGYTAKVIRKNTKNLEDLGVITISHSQSVPPRKMYQFNQENLDKLEAQIEALNDSLMVPMGQYIMSQQDNIINNNKYNKDTSSNLSDSQKVSQQLLSESLMNFSNSSENKYNTTENNNLFTSEENKDNYPENTIITFWNTFPEVSTHKRTSKVYKQISDMLESIRLGTFSPEIDKQWRLDNKLKNVFNQPLSEKDIKLAIVDYVKQFDAEYSPSDKTKLTKSCKDFVYNAFTKKSQLLYILNNPPQKLGELQENTFRKKIPQEVRKRIDSILEYKSPNMNAERRKWVYMQVVKTLKEMDRLVEELSPYHKHNSAWKSYIANKDELIRQWLDYIQNYKEIKKNFFAPTGYVWDSFLEELESRHGVILTADQETLNRLEKEQKLRTKREHAQKVENKTENEDIVDLYS